MPSNMQPRPRISSAQSGKRSDDELQGFKEPREALQSRLIVPSIKTRCFHCGKMTSHPRIAFSTHCQHCHAYIKLDAVHLYPLSHKTRIRTRGDVFIKEESHLNHLNIICQHLHMKGPASGSFQCYGTLYIECNTRIDGIIRAKCLMIAPNVEVSIRKQALVEECLLMGTLIGNIQCVKQMKIDQNGVAIGDIISPKLLIEDKGAHHGFWTLS